MFVTYLLIAFVVGPVSQFINQPQKALLLELFSIWNKLLEKGFNETIV